MSNGPRQRRPRQQHGTQAPIRQFDVQISFDRDAFLNALQTHGVRFEHFRSVPDPTGMASKGDNHAVMTGNVRTNSDGFIYEKVGCFQALFTTNSSSTEQFPEGNVSFSSAYVTPDDRYEGDNSPDHVLLAPYDRLYLKDVESRVIHRQYVEATTTGLDKLQYPATCVEHLRDANGRVYKEGVDFEITLPDDPVGGGHIRWIGENRPGWNIKVGRGTVYSIRYRYTPFFIVSRLMHEIRVAQISNPMTFDRTVERMPYQVQVMRENVFFDQNIDPNRPVPPQERFAEAPSPAGLMGPDPSGLLGPDQS